MFTKFYSFGYPRDLAYMLQNVEYEATDFFKWVWFDLRAGGLPNVVDFTFKLTKRSKLVVALATILYWGLLALGIFLAVASSGWVAVVGIVIAVLFPFITADILGFIAWIIGSLQRGRDEDQYLANIERKLSGHKATVVAIAGSYGKSTMRDTLASVLRSGRSVATPSENHNTPAGISQFVDTLKGDEDILIIELGEYVPGDVEKLARVVKPDYGIITGVNDTHMMRMKSKENTIATIYELAEFVEPENLYVNGESDWALEGMPEGATAYGGKGVGGWHVSKVKPDLSGVKFTLKKGKKVVEAASPLLGRHQVGPLAVCAALASRIGLGPKQIQKGLAVTKQFPRRFEFKTWPGNITIIDDTYNGNKDGFLAAIDFLNGLKGSGTGKRIYVTPGIIELGREAEAVHQMIGKVLAESKVEKIYLVRNRLSEIIQSSFEHHNGTADLHMIDNQQDFLLNISSYATPGDLIFLQNSQQDHFFYN